MPQIIGSSGQTVNAVGQSTMAVHASVVRAVGAGGSGGSAVASVDGRTGAVTLDDLYDAAGAAQAVADGLGTAAALDAGSADGVAELDSGGKVPSSQLPSYVDDVVEVANFAALPGTGETGLIYVTLDTNLTYRWSGSAYVEISASLALGETSGTAYRGDRGKTAYDHSQVVSGNPHGTTATDVGADPAGTAAGLVDDLSGVSNQATARTNLGLGTAATAATGDFAAASHTHTGTQVAVDASGFNGNLTTSDDTVQEIAQKLDDLVAGGTVASVISSATFPGHAPIGPNHAPTLGSVNHGLGGLGWEAYAPFFCPAGTYDAIGVLSTVAAVSTWRLGIDDNTAGWPGAVLLDAGTVNMNATAGWQAITGLTFTVAHPRWLWTHVKCVAYTASPTVQCLDGVGSAGSSPRIPGWPTYSSLPNRALVGARSFINSGSAGVLTAAGPMGPNSATQVGFTQTAPLILLRRSS
jgi:hypothetical protein